MEKLIDKKEAARRAGMGVAYLLRLAGELGIVAQAGWQDTAAGRRPASFFKPEDVDRILELKRRKREARPLAANAARWGRRPEEKK